MVVLGKELKSSDAVMPSSPTKTKFGALALKLSNEIRRYDGIDLTFV
jgi:hypothetical protein